MSLSAIAWQNYYLAVSFLFLLYFGIKVRLLHSTVLKGLEITGEFKTLRTSLDVSGLTFTVMLHKGWDPLTVMLQGTVSLYHLACAWHSRSSKTVFVEINNKENNSRPLESNAKMPQAVRYNISQTKSFLSSLTSC